MTAERTLYRESSPWPLFASVILWVVISLSCYAVITGPDPDLSTAQRRIVATAMVAFALLLHLLLGRLTVRVQQTRVLLHFGFVPLVRRIVPFAEIVSVRSIRYRPIRDFGGWGLRGFGRRRAWTARGDQAVELTLTGGRQLLVGSDHPRRLEAAIRSYGGPLSPSRPPGPSP